MEETKHEYYTFASMRPQNTIISVLPLQRFFKGSTF